MSKFYTNVTKFGNKILVRGYNGSQKFTQAIKYSPHLFIDAKEECVDNWTAFITNKKIERKDFDSIKDARDFIDNYSDVSGLNIYGNTNYVSQYISSQWTNDVVYDPKLIDAMIIDIETETCEAKIYADTHIISVCDDRSADKEVRKMSIAQYNDRFNTGNSYLVYDTEKNEYMEFKKSCFAKVHGGFPEPEHAREKITLITCKRKGRKAVTFAWTPVEGPTLDCEFRLHTSEETMLVGFITWLANNPPDVISGWNVEAFDIPYICVRIFNVLGEDHMKRLSPHGLVNMREIEVFGRKELRFDISGISILDYMLLYKKYAYVHQESYSLDFIATTELGVGKLDHSEFISFQDFYKGRPTVTTEPKTTDENYAYRCKAYKKYLIGESIAAGNSDQALRGQYDTLVDELRVEGWHRFCSYNIIDCERVEQLDEKLQLLSLIYSISYLAKVNYNDCFSPVKVWETYLYNVLLKKHMSIAISNKKKLKEPYEGAYVKDTISGSYDWIVTFDLTSLYPHLIMLCNISPECIIDKNLNIAITDLINKTADLSELKRDNTTMAGNSQLFTRDIDGLFPEVMHSLFLIRKKYKDEMLSLKKTNGSKSEIAALDMKQMAVKVLLNSLYGAAGNQHFKFYDLRIAEGISLTGQLVIRWLNRTVNAYMNKILKTSDIDYIIAVDTDSIMVNFGPFVKAVCPEKNTQETIKFLDKICDKQFGDFIHKSLAELSDYINAKEHSMHMKRENICDRGIFLKKKRYMLNVWNSEGKQYDEAEHKVIGIELVKTSTPAIVRAKLREAIPILFHKTEDDIRNFVNATKEKFYSETPENVAFPRGVSEIEKWQSSSNLYMSGTPINVRAAILHNHLVKTMGLEDKYQLIVAGTKIKYVYLKMPNPLHEDVIGFVGELPVEFGLHAYINYDAQFDGAFIKSLTSMVEPLGWELEKKASMSHWGI